MADTTLAGVFMRNAEDDLRSAGQSSSAERHDRRNRAYNSQQAAEKALKAALILTGKHPHRTHDLGKLHKDLSPNLEVDVSLADLIRLTRMAVDARYGNGGTAPSKSEADWAFSVATKIVSAVRASMADRRT